MGNPISPEAAADRHGREIGMHGVARVFRDDATLLAGFVRWLRLLGKLLFENPLNGRLANMEACSGQPISDLHLAQCGTEQLDPLDHIANDFRES